jgi:hypothetical protein
MAKERFADHRLYTAMTLYLGRVPSDEEFEELLDFVEHREEFLAWKAWQTSNGTAGRQP